MSNIIVQNGKPVFIGKEDPHNPPVSPRKGTQMECPRCHSMVDYLVGEDTKDGGKQGCESCWKPGKMGKTNDTYDTSKEML